MYVCVYILFCDVLLNVCMFNVQVDIIAIDFSDKLPFRLKQPVIKAAIKVCSLRKPYRIFGNVGFVINQNGWILVIKI